MGQIHSAKYQDTALDSVSMARLGKASHLVSSDLDATNGDRIFIDGKAKINFASCCYLSLENNQERKEKAKEYIEKYGTIYGISRGYVSNSVVEALEERFSKMFDGRPCLTYSSTSLAHISVLPVIIGSKDLIVFDQQVHFSVQTAAKINQCQGTETMMIRHNNMNMLERVLKNKVDKYEKIWYLIDGVYSMYGDVPPCEEILELMNKYPSLYVYADDAHGIGWAGKYGTGYIFDKMFGHEHFFLATTLGKAFSATGGLIVFPNHEWHDKVRLFGGPLSYSHPLNPFVMGASEGTLDIFMSDELPILQADLKTKNAYLHQKINEAGLILLSDPVTPIFYIGIGKPNVTYNIARRVIEEGFVMTVGFFPAVSNNCSGLRISMNRYRTFEEIDQLVEVIKHHYSIVLDEEGIKENQIRRAFKLPLVEEKKVVKEEAFVVQQFDSINKIDPDEWNGMMLDRGVFDWLGLIGQENVFKGNELPEQNFDFIYLIVKDKNTGNPIVGTFMTYGLMKDDMLDPAAVSIQLEITREKDPYYLTSKMLSMGSMFTEGEHLYIDKYHENWKEGLKCLLLKIQNIYDELNADGILLRDLNANDDEVIEVIKEEGYAKKMMPKANIIFNNYENFDDYYQKASANRKKKIRKDIFKYKDNFKLELKPDLSIEETKKFNQLFNNIKSRNKTINYFDYPDDFLQKLGGGENWEYFSVFMRLEPKGEFLPEPVAMMICYNGNKSYTPLFIGLDEQWKEGYGVYKHSLYYCVERAMELKKEIIYFGMTADETKKYWFGSDSFPKAAFVQLRDLYNQKVIATLSKDKMIAR